MSAKKLEYGAEVGDTKAHLVLECSGMSRLSAYHPQTLRYSGAVSFERSKQKILYNLSDMEVTSKRLFERLKLAEEGIELLLSSPGDKKDSWKSSKREVIQCILILEKQADTPLDSR